MSQEEYNPYLDHTLSGDQGGFQGSAQGKQPTFEKQINLSEAIFENQVDLSEAYQHESPHRDRGTKTNRAAEQVEVQEDMKLVYPPSIDRAEGIALTQQYSSVREFVFAQLAAHEAQISNIHAPDPSIPRTDVQRKKLVRQLVAAMTYIGDDVNKKDARKNDSHAVTKIKGLTATAEGRGVIEKVAWEVLVSFFQYYIVLTC